ncbi:MAG: hypothetical protein ACLPLP_21510 [Mycobacterium sp.]
MDTVLGASMSPSTIRMVLVEGENADGVTVKADDLGVATADEPATVAAADHLVTAILDAREGADEGGDQVRSIGVTWTDQLEVAALREALAARDVEDVTLISPFLAAAALAQTAGRASEYDRIAMLFIEPACATLAVVDVAEGSITDLRKEPLNTVDDAAEVTEMIACLESRETCPEGLFVVGSAVDIGPITPQLQTATSLLVTAPEEPETALARGAALASANAPLFASSTTALAYAQNPGTGEVDLDAVAPGYFYVSDVPPGGEQGEEELAYSAVPDEEADALTEVMHTAQDGSLDASERRRRSVLLLGIASAVVAISAVVAMEIALALGIRPGVALRPSPGHDLIVPTEQAPAPSGKSSEPQPRYISQPGAVAAPHPLNPPAPVEPPAAPVSGAPSVPVPGVVPLPGVPDPAAVPHAPAPDSPPSPLNVPAPQPPAHAPAPSPVSQPPTHVPVSHPPVHVPVPQPPAHVPEPPPPVHLPPPDAPRAPDMPGHGSPPAPGTPGHESPPAPDIPPARGGEGGSGGGLGDDVGGHPSGGGGNEGGAGGGAHSGGEIGGGGSSGAGGSEIGGGSIGAPSGGASSGGASSSGGGSSGGGREIGGGASSGGGGGEISSGGSSGGGGGESSGGGHHEPWVER